MNEIINIGVGTDVKLTARLVDAQGNAINLNQVTELRAVIYNGDRQRTLSDYNIVDDTSVEFVLRSGTELTAGDQVAISMAIRYKKEGFVNSTPIIEIIHRGWVGEEITPMAMPMAVVNSAITAQFTISVPPAVYYAGASPRIGANGHWYIFDDVTKEYVDTNFGANLSNEQIIADETERRRQEAIRVAAEIQREVRMRQVEDKVNNVGENLRYLREDVDARISPTVDGVEMKGSDDADQIVKLSLSTKDARPKFVRNNTPKELALKDDVDDVSNNKFDKSKVLPAYPSAEPTDDTGVISAKQQYKKDKEQADKMFQLEQDVNKKHTSVCVNYPFLNDIIPNNYKDVSFKIIAVRKAKGGEVVIKNMSTGGTIQFLSSMGSNAVGWELMYNSSSKIFIYVNWSSHTVDFWSENTNYDFSFSGSKNRYCIELMRLFDKYEIISTSFDSNGIVNGHQVKFTDGEIGSVSKSSFDENTLEYSKIVITRPEITRETVYQFSDLGDIISSNDKYYR